MWSEILISLSVFCLGIIPVGTGLVCWDVKTRIKLLEHNIKVLANEEPIGENIALLKSHIECLEKLKGHFSLKIKSK